MAFGGRFRRVWRRNLRVNENNSKVMRCIRRLGVRRINNALNIEILKKIKCFKHYRSKIVLDGGIETKINNVGKELDK